LRNLQKNGIDPDDVAKRIVRAENAEGNPYLKNVTTSATGLGQFTDETWRDLIKKYRRDLFDWWSPDPQGLLELRTDAELSRQMVAANADKHAKELEETGLPVTKGTIYLAHHFGRGGAKAILTAEPNTLAMRVLTPGAVTENRNVITPTTTVQDLRSWADDVIENGPGVRRGRR
jgi:hypothetical protein